MYKYDLNNTNDSNNNKQTCFFCPDSLTRVWRFEYFAACIKVDERLGYKTCFFTDKNLNMETIHSPVIDK